LAFGNGIPGIDGIENAWMLAIVKSTAMAKKTFIIWFRYDFTKQAAAEAMSKFVIKFVQIDSEVSFNFVTKLAKDGSTWTLELGRNWNTISDGWDGQTFDPTKMSNDLLNML